MTELQQNFENKTKPSYTIDAVIIGAGFSGLYMLHLLRRLGISVRVFEAADGVGGTWYWNRYPGARCDIQSMQYSYSFNQELEQEWHWTERYASQPEILRYLNHVADKFDLRKDIQLQTRVTTAIFDEAASRWNIQTNRNDQVSARFCIMATGCLSEANLPDMNGLNTFQGNIYHTGQWPHEGVDFKDQRVAIIGTGSSGVQSVPIIAEQAAHVYVFQRTPNFCVPARNAPLDPSEEKAFKATYDEHRHRALQSYTGIEMDGAIELRPALSVTSEERQQTYEKVWQIGGFSIITAFSDILQNKEANDTLAEFVRAKIRSIVKDPTVAEILLPYDHAVGSKRLCIGTNYYETYNRDNVTLINLRKEKIEEITSTGLKTESKFYQLDSIVFATGFDAMTGALCRIDIQGRSRRSLNEKWAQGPNSYLGIMTAGFPNFFIMTGPGSPSVLSNMVVSIEQHCEWISECIDYLRQNNLDCIETTIEAEDAWTNHVNEIANATLFPTASSWYTGANIPGKPRVFRIYAGGVPLYRQKCNDVTSNGYEGFRLIKSSSESFVAAK